MSIESRLHDRAAALLSAGKRQDAQRVLTAVLHKNPANQTAWRQYQSTAPSPDAFQRLVSVIKRRHTHFKPPFSPLIVKPILFHTPRRRVGGLALALVALMAIALLAWSAMDGKTRSAYWESLAANRQTENSALQADLNGLETRYQSLDSDHTALSQAHTQLENEHVSLLQAHQQLKNEKLALQQAFDGLQAEYAAAVDDLTALQNSFDQLAATHNQLTFDFNTLNQTYSSLYTEYEHLQERSLQPPYIAVNGRHVYMAFYHSSGEIMHWDVEFEHLEDAIRRGYRARLLNELFSNVKLNSSEGDPFFVPDFRGFVDPEPFRGVMTELYRRSASDEQFVYEVWNIVAQLTTYTDETLEVPRYPLETLLAGGGDCEDSSILVASMLKAAPVDWQVDLVYMDSYNPYAPNRPNHVLVYVHTNHREYWIETTSDAIMEPNRDIIGWYFTID